MFGRASFSGKGRFVFNLNKDFGTQGDDTLAGTEDTDFIWGRRGDDVILGSSGYDYIDGGQGFDVVSFEGSVLDYDIGDGLNHLSRFAMITALEGAPTTGSTSLKDVEALYFAADDYTYYLDGTNNAVLAGDDTAAAVENVELTIAGADLLANDVEFDGDRMVIIAVDATSALGASVSLVDGNVVYFPDTAFDALAEGDVVTDTFTYTVDDGLGGTDVATVTVTVTGTNDDPVLTIDNAVTIDENTTDVTTAQVTDVDGTTATYSLSGADAALFTIDQTTGALSFVTAPDFEAPEDDGADNVYNVTVTATDEFGGTDSADVAVTVADVLELPVIDARINEFHYDNDGSDTGEFIEIRTAAGDDVSFLTVELVNGSTGLVYNTIAVNGTDMTSDGTYDYYVINLPTNGLQNGSPDGIVLTNGPEVIEFLSYEGSLDAVNGAAAGMTSTDIGVSEAGSTPVGFSLQRNDDGTWREPEENTSGAENVPVVEPAQIVITEIMQNPSAVADSAGEYFEIYNAGTEPVDINGWTVSDNDFDSFVIDNGGPLIVPAGGYLVLGNNADSATNGGVPVDYQYSGMFLANGADEIVLTDTNSVEIDRVEYDGGPNFPDPSGASMELIDVTLDNNVGANWTTAEDAFGDGDLGTPGASNDGPVDLTPRINELHYDNEGADTGEFFEVRVAAGTDVSAMSVELYNGDNGAMYGRSLLANRTPTSDGTYDYYKLNFLGIQNGSPDGLALVDNGEVIEFLSYEGTFTATTSTATGLTSEDIGVFEDGSTPVGFSLQRNEDGTWSAPSENTGGAANTEGDPGPDATAVKISEIQGQGGDSLLLGQSVSVTAVVTYVTTDGFFLQEEDIDADGDLLTSEGIFVFTGGGDLVSLGDVMTVTGTVDEFFGLTQIVETSTEFVTTTTVMPTPATITLSPDMAINYEAYEGMQVLVESGTADPLTVITNFNLDRFGQITVSSGNQYQPTQLYDAQTQAAEIDALQEANANNSLLLDDGIDSQNPSSFNYLPGGPGDDGDGVLNSTDDFSDAGSTIRLGAEIEAPIQGIMSYGFGEYRVIVTETLQIDETTNSGARTDAPEDVGGTLQIASYNVLNYFTTIDVTGAGTGPDGTLDPRGADTVEEFERQSAKIVDGIIGTGAEVIALQEIENNGTGAIGTLVDQLNAEGTAANYAYVDPTGTGDFIGTDAITTGIIYDANAVTLLHSEYIVYDEPSAATTFAIADEIQTALGISEVDDFDRNRPTVVATFIDNATGQTFTVASSHFKSKGQSGLQDLADAAQAHLDAGGTDITQAQLDALLADPNFDQGDGQGFWNGVRTDAAQELDTFISTVYNGGGVDNVLLLGDMNAYAEEDPVQFLDDDAGYVDLIDAFIGQDVAYSYVFDGQRGTLDQGLADAAFAGSVTGVTEWHINADEPDLINYDTSFNDPAFYNDGVYASSDHDPLIIGVEFDTLIFT